MLRRQRRDPRPCVNSKALCAGRAGVAGRTAPMNEIPCPLLFCRGVLKHVSSGFPRRTPEDSSVIGARSLQHPHSCIVLRGVAVAIPSRACAATCYASAAVFFVTRTRHGNLFDIRDHPHAGVHSSAAHMQDETRLFLGFARVVCGVHGWPARLPALLDYHIFICERQQQQQQQQLLPE